MDREELIPCPFCGTGGYSVHLQRVYYENENYTRWKVICEGCGAEITEFPTPERAIENWNRRAI